MARFLSRGGIRQGIEEGPLGILLLLFLFVLALYPEILRGTHSLFYRDFGLFGAPIAAFHRQAFWEGQVPLWNALNNCGLPFAAQWNTLVFYPFSFLYLLLPFPWSLNLFVVVHLLLGGACMYLLARDWLEGKHPLGASLAAFVFAWNGLTLHSLMWPNNIAAYGWMPLVILHLKQGCLRGGRALFSGSLIAGVQMLTGAPEIILFTWILGLIYLLIRCGDGPKCQTALRLGSMTALVLGVAAIQLLPFVSLVEASHRDRNLAGQAAWAMPAWGIANFFVPLFRCTPALLGVFSQDEQQWTSSYYMGSGVIVLALLALWKVRSWRVWCLGCLLLLTLWFAMGREGGLYSAIGRVFPFLGFARYPIKVVVIATVLFSLLAAEGLAWVLEQNGRTRKKTLLGSGFVFLGMLALILFIGYHFPFPGDIWSSTWRSGVGSALSAAIFLGVLVVFLGAKSSRQKFWSALLLLVSMGLDIATHAPRQNPVVPIDTLRPTEAPDLTKPVTFQPRVMLSGRFKSFMENASTPDPYQTWTGYRRAFSFNANLYDFEPKVDGFYSLYLKEESVLRDLLEATPQSEVLPILNFMGVHKVPHPSVLFSWVDRTNHLPLVTGGQTPVFLEEKQSLERVMSRSFQPLREVVLPRGAEKEAESTYDPHPVFSQLRTGKAGLEFMAKADKPAWVVIAQSYHPPWRVSIDGQAATLWRANHAFQAFKLPPGEHRVNVHYQDTRFFWGTFISLCSLGLCISGACLPKAPAVTRPFFEKEDKLKLTEGGKV